MTTIDVSRVALSAIENAERRTPFCRCGEPTIPMGSDLQVWLLCSKAGSATRLGEHGLIAKLAARGHTRQLIVEDEAA